MDHSTEKCSGSDACCDRGAAESVAVRQTLSEMDFERGIWYAAQNNDIDRVRSLLGKGISADVQDGAGYTALHYGSRSGSSEVCELLIRSGADVNATTRSGNATALHRSAMRGARDVVELLLKHGTDPNARDADGFTALHRAILNDRASVCRLLLPVTNHSISDNKFRTPERLARERNNPEILDLFNKTRSAGSEAQP